MSRKRWKALKKKEPILHRKEDLKPPKRKKPDGVYYDDIKIKDAK